MRYTDSVILVWAVIPPDSPTFVSVETAIIKQTNLKKNPRKKIQNSYYTAKKNANTDLISSVAQYAAQYCSSAAQFCNCSSICIVWAWLQLSSAQCQLGQCRRLGVGSLALGRLSSAVWGWCDQLESVWFVQRCADCRDGDKGSRWCDEDKDRNDVTK